MPTSCMYYVDTDCCFMAPVEVHNWLNQEPFHTSTFLICPGNETKPLTVSVWYVVVKN